MWSVFRVVKGEKTMKSSAKLRIPVFCRRTAFESGADLELGGGVGDLFQSDGSVFQDEE